MITSSESDTAALLKLLERRVTRLESEREPEGSVNILHHLDETEQTADSASATVGGPAGLAWGSGEWGYSAWA